MSISCPRRGGSSYPCLWCPAVRFSPASVVVLAVKIQRSSSFSFLKAEDKRIRKGRNGSLVSTSKETKEPPSRQRKLLRISPSIQFDGGVLRSAANQVFIIHLSNSFSLFLLIIMELLGFAFLSFPLPWEEKPPLFSAGSSLKQLFNKSGTPFFS